MTESDSARVEQIVRTARDAWRAAPTMGDETYRAFGARLVEAVDKRWAELREANAADLEAGRARRFPEALLERMSLCDHHLDGLRDLAASVAVELPGVLSAGPPVAGPGGVRSHRLPKPLGVVLMVYEARPTVTVEGALLTVSTANAAILRAGREVSATTAVFGSAIAAAIEASGLPAGLVQVLHDPDRRLLRGLLGCHDAIDVLIPRGSPSLIDYCHDATRIPVVASGGGVNHLYVHRSADLRLAATAALDSKLPAPAGCTSLEMLLVDESVTSAFLATLGAVAAERDWPAFALRLPASLVRTATAAGLTAEPLGEVDDGREFLDRTLALRPVSGLEAAIGHIARHGSGHTEGVFATSAETTDRFCGRVDAATIVVNGSLRLNDGPTMGIGPELAISTNRLHVRGPVTMDALVTRGWVVDGGGALRDEPPPPRQRPAVPSVPADQARAAVSVAVRRLVIRESRLSLQPGDISEDEPLDGPLLRINSLGFVGMLVRLEDELDVSLPDEVLVGRRFDTVRDMVDVIARSVGAGGAGGDGR